MICQMIPNQLDSLRNPFDCDGEFEMDASRTKDITPPKKQNEELLSEKDMELPHLPGEHIPAGIPDPSTVITKQSTKNIGSTSVPQKVSKKDPRSMLVELESKEHDERMKNLRKNGKILDCELQIKKRKLEMMEEEHALKIEVLRNQINRVVD
ncbi:unnamed protein product [Orchesella dallaii]|uniref:Uncharacterized protein n=1 Tax=Orchesella dallaii TaxID=48710 RepID=A0ABP1SAV9_9HEXA